MKWIDRWSTGGNKRVRKRLDGHRGMKKISLCTQGNHTLENSREEKVKANITAYTVIRNCLRITDIQMCFDRNIKYCVNEFLRGVQ
jgi:hypothetical protein